MIGDCLHEGNCIFSNLFLLRDAVTTPHASSCPVTRKDRERAENALRGSMGSESKPRVLHTIHDIARMTNQVISQDKDSKCKYDSKG